MHTPRLVIPHGAPRDVWLRARADGIGSSDAAAVMRVDGAWGTPVKVYASKVIDPAERDAVNDDQEAEHLEAGHRAEPMIGQWAADRLGVRIQPCGLYAHPKYDWMRCTPDFRILGALMGIEAKNVAFGPRARLWGNDGDLADEGTAPFVYYVQTQWQMEVMGWEMVYLAAFIFGRKLVTIRVPRDDAFIEDQLIPVCRDFWFNNVRARRVPVPTHKDVDVIRELVGDPAPGKVIQLGAEEREMVRLYDQAHAAGKQAEETKNEIKAQLVLRLGDAETGMCPDGTPIHNNFGKPAQKRMGRFVKGEWTWNKDYREALFDPFTQDAPTRRFSIGRRA